MLIQRRCSARLYYRCRQLPVSFSVVGSVHSKFSLLLSAHFSTTCKVSEEYTRESPERFRARELEALERFEESRKAQKNDGRNRLSKFWTPTGGLNTEGGSKESAHSWLIKAGLLRQAHSGLFHLLPLGLKVQEKLEKLVDKHMTNLAASKVSLSTFSTEDLWQRSGRLPHKNPALFCLEDRKGVKYLLSPTHEEEITTLVKDIVKSYKELPLRLYQITRKYRDEARPRQGLLRAREFLMKDLYTFDATEVEALKTYTEVQQAYRAFFDELKLPYLVAQADSGDIGGNLSHEYHFPSASGEDNIVTCDTCDYVANEEVAVNKRVTTLGSDKIIPPSEFRIKYHVCDSSAIKITTRGIDIPKEIKSKIRIWYHTSAYRDRLYVAVLPRYVRLEDSTSLPQNSEKAQLNKHLLKKLFEYIDLGVEDPVKDWLGRLKRTAYFAQDLPFKKKSTIEIIFDYRVPSEIGKLVINSLNPTANRLKEENTTISGEKAPDLVRNSNNTRCSICGTGTLRIRSAIEVGHTFHLGDRYSFPLDARVATAGLGPVFDLRTSRVSYSGTVIQMGCHGIGLSRMIAAVAEALADEKGLNWPRAIAPFEVVVIPAKDHEEDASKVYDVLVGKATSLEDPTPLSSQTQEIDVLLDDRSKELAWKLKDADMIGYPIIVILGKAWKAARECEVQCRRLGSLKEKVPIEGLRNFIGNLLAQL